MKGLTGHQALLMTVIGLLLIAVGLAGIATQSQCRQNTAQFSAGAEAGIM